MSDADALMWTVEKDPTLRSTVVTVLTLDPSADWDGPDNIVHLVLARPEGHGPGTKGLSLFFVPKFHFDPETGEIGERNGAFVTNIEHKMGIKASVTGELSFGQHGVPAKGWLVGEVHDGIAQMFKVIEYARMMVGTKAIATLSTGYLNALEFARTRMQAADLTRSTRNVRISPERSSSAARYHLPAWNTRPYGATTRSASSRPGVAYRIRARRFERIATASVRTTSVAARPSQKHLSVTRGDSLAERRIAEACSS